jgi:hypothetical protein
MQTGAGYWPDMYIFGIRELLIGSKRLLLIFKNSSVQNPFLGNKPVSFA